VVKGQADPAIGVVFDKVVTRDGHEAPLRSVTIRAIDEAEGAASAGVTDSGMMTGSGGGMAAEHAGAVGLVGRTTGVVGSTVSAGIGAGGRATDPLAASGSVALQAGHGAVDGVDASGLLTAECGSGIGGDIDGQERSPRPGNSIAAEGAGRSFR
jgi:hypothetical protein